MTMTLRSPGATPRGSDPREAPSAVVSVSVENERHPIKPAAATPKSATSGSQRLLGTFTAFILRADLPKPPAGRRIPLHAQARALRNWSGAGHKQGVLMRKRLLPWLAAAVMMSIPALAAAQASQTAVLTGTVTDPSGAPVPGVTVTAMSPALIAGSQSTVTETNGTYRFPALAPGLYTVTAELQGFSTARRENVRLLLGQTITVDHTLAVGARTENVMV